MNAIHLRCAREAGGGLANLTFDKASGTYRSGSWNIRADDAASLVGGWLYLHEAKTVPSQFGGKILAVEPAGQATDAKEQVVLVVQPARQGRGQKWRGKGSMMAWSGGLVEPTLPHER
jgi:hypothetical protein